MSKSLYLFLRSARSSPRSTHSTLVCGRKRDRQTDRERERIKEKEIEREDGFL